MPICGWVPGSEKKEKEEMGEEDFWVVGSPECIQNTVFSLPSEQLS